MMSLRVRRMLLLAVALVGAGLIALYACIDPGSSRFFPRCMFYMLTGWECPGCGSQRAVHALLSGDIAAAWVFNPLFLLEIPLIGLLILVGMVPGRFPRLERVLVSRTFILSLLAVIVGFTVFRNIL